MLSRSILRKRKVKSGYLNERILIFSTVALTLSTLCLFMSGHFKFLLPFLLFTVPALVLFLLNEMKKSS